MTNDTDPADCASPEETVRRLLQAEAAGIHADLPGVRSISTPPGISPKATCGPTRLSRLTMTTWQKLGNISRPARAAITSYRPTPRHLALLVLAVLFVIRPWFIAALALLGFVLLVICYLTLGPDRAGELVAAWFDRLTRRDPDGAEKLRARAERLSATAAKLVGTLPDRWVSGLYLPDFSRGDDGQELPPGEPFDRLANPGQGQQDATRVSE